MFEITVKIDEPMNNAQSHAEVRIKDLMSEEIYIVSFSKKKRPAGTTKEKKITMFNYEELVSKNNTNCYGPRSIKLYSNIETSMQEFITDIEEKFRHFNLCFNNCSDAANYTLNFFFPVSENKKVEEIWQSYKRKTFLCCLVTGGVLPFFGTPPFTNGPLDILKKAQLLSKAHGDESREAFQHDEGYVEKEEPADQSMESYSTPYSALSSG